MSATNYKINKLHTRANLEWYIQQHPEYANIFSDIYRGGRLCGKADDIADSFMQIFGYIQLSTIV